MEQLKVGTNDLLSVAKEKVGATSGQASDGEAGASGRRQRRPTRDRLLHAVAASVTQFKVELVGNLKTGYPLIQALS
jgi:hypothetical protein